MELGESFILGSKFCRPYNSTDFPSILRKEIILIKNIYIYKIIIIGQIVKEGACLKENILHVYDH